MVSVTALLVAGIAFLAIFTQSLSGFGLALVSMPLLTPLLGLRTAAPLVALMGGLAEAALLFRYRQALNLKAVWRLGIASLITIPLGVLALDYVNQEFALAVLGAVTIGYALYALLNLTLPELQQPAWAYGFGLVAGLLGGAFNSPGPPVIIYGNCRRWTPRVFKGNLQGYFLLNSLAVILSHALNANLTPEVWRLFLVTIPAVALGLIAGGSLDRLLNPARFRKLVLWLLVALGLRLIF